MKNAELAGAGFSYLFGLPVAAQVQAVELAQHGSSVHCIAGLQAVSRASLRLVTERDLV